MTRPTYKSLSAWIAICPVALVLSFGCSKADTSQPQPQARQAAPATTPPAAPTAAETTTPETATSAAEPQAAPKTPATAPATAAPSSAVLVPVKDPPAAKPPVAEIPAPAATPPASTTPAPPAPPAAAAHAAVGSEKCKMCHRVQYASWAASKHASANPPAACETCHGNGADYAKMSVMKDAALAKAAGLVMPGKEFCTAKCHKAEAFTEDMLQKAHAHKAK